MDHLAYVLAPIATIDKERLANRSTKKTASFPKTAKKYYKFVLTACNKPIIEIVHAETDSRMYGYIAHVELRIRSNFFELILGSGTDYIDHMKTGGCGYDKHNYATCSMLNHIGIEVLPRRGIIGQHEYGSLIALKAIANHLVLKYDIEAIAEQVFI